MQVALQAMQNVDLEVGYQARRKYERGASCRPGSVPVPGADSIALATSQPADQWLDYSRATQGPGVLTIQYKTDPAKTTIYRYDPALNPAVQTASGNPIYVVTSTGRKGADT